MGISNIKPINYAFIIPFVDEGTYHEDKKRKLSSWFNWFTGKLKKSNKEQLSCGIPGYGKSFTVHREIDECNFAKDSSGKGEYFHNASDSEKARILYEILRDFNKSVSNCGINLTKCKVESYLDLHFPSWSFFAEINSYLQKEEI